MHQDGLGDDILSGNSLALIGLYKAIYGINPLYNRLYLNPHITDKLSGTNLFYNFRNDKLTIGLTTNVYSIANEQFKVSSKFDFGFYSENNELTWFSRNDERFSLKANTASALSLEILKWDADEFTWNQLSNNETGKISYNIYVLKANKEYTVSDGIKSWKLKSNKNGFLEFELKSGNNLVTIN